MGIWAVVAALACLVLAGCFGSDEPPAATGDPVGSPSATIAQPEHAFVTPEGLIDVAPWFEDLGEVRARPGESRLVQLERFEADGRLLRLLADGPAFWVVLYDEAPLVGATLLARVVDVTTNVTVARGGSWASEPCPCVVEVPAFDRIHLGGVYRVEVLVLVPETPHSVPSEWRAEDVRPLVQNGTVLLHWDAPVRLRASFDVSFDGPTEAVDRPAPLEHAAFGGPPTGTYTATVSGERIWLVDLLLEFSPSIVVGTTPVTTGNGTTSVHIQVDGFHDLDHWRYLPRERGLTQSFTMEVVVDYETVEEVPGLPTESDQLFFLTASFAHRIGAETYSAGTRGRDIVVHVAPQWAP